MSDLKVNVDLALVWECRSDSLPGDTLGVDAPSLGKEAWSKRTQTLWH